MKNSKLVILIICILVFVGALALFAFPKNKDISIPYDENASFNKMFVLPKGKMVTVGDELKIKLVSVGDSRCPENMQCIWQGEITYNLQISNNGYTEEIELGTVRTKEEEFEDYKITLDDSNDSTEYVSLIVKK